MNRLQLYFYSIGHLRSLSQHKLFLPNLQLRNSRNASLKKADSFWVAIWIKESSKANTYLFFREKQNSYSVPSPFYNKSSPQSAVDLLNYLCNLLLPSKNIDCLYICKHHLPLHWAILTVIINHCFDFSQPWKFQSGSYLTCKKNIEWEKKFWCKMGSSMYFNI